QALDHLFGERPGSSMALDADGGEAADISAQARFYGILRGVREVAVRPLLVALDDAHWSDPDSLTVIHLICRRLASLPVALIATARPWPAESVTSAQDLAVQGMVEIELLAPLSAEASRELLCLQVAGDVSTTVVDQAIDLCGGTRFRPAVATEVAGLSTVEAATEIDGLFRGGLLYEADDGWARFTHGLIRQGVYDDIAPPMRRDLHTDCFRTLVASGAFIRRRPQNMR
ncbi:MAG: hypothetical protein WCB57_14340, partial [Pseudonocardiaceae bacterium]